MSRPDRDPSSLSVCDGGRCTLYTNLCHPMSPFPSTGLLGSPRPVFVSGTTRLRPYPTWTPRSPRLHYLHPTKFRHSVSSLYPPRGVTVRSGRRVVCSQVGGPTLWRHLNPHFRHLNPLRPPARPPSTLSPFSGPGSVLDCRVVTTRGLFVGVTHRTPDDPTGV